MSDVAVKRNGWRVHLLAVGLLLAAILAARAFGLGASLGRLRGWIEGLGPWAPLAYVLIYIAGVVAALPGSALTLAAGALFGSVIGVLLVSIASTVGAALAFLVARYFARESVAVWLAGNEKFRRLDRLAARHGAFVVGITRLVPLFPFNLLNYGFGLTGVSFRTYVFWSWLCMLPGTVLYVVGADVVFRSLGGGDTPRALIAVLAAVAVGFFFLVRYALARLREKEDADNPEGDSDADRTPDRPAG